MEKALKFLMKLAVSLTVLGLLVWHVDRAHTLFTQGDYSLLPEAMHTVKLCVAYLLALIVLVGFTLSPSKD